MQEVSERSAIDPGKLREIEKRPFRRIHWSTCKRSPDVWVKKKTYEGPLRQTDLSETSGSGNPVKVMSTKTESQVNLPCPMRAIL